MENHTHPKIFRYSLPMNPNTLNPQETDGIPEMTIAYHIYEGLMRTYQNQLRYGIAESYEISTDGRTYTFHLRDAAYGDGTPVRAEDFVRAVQRMVTEESSSRPFFAYPIRNAMKIHDGELSIADLGVSAIDEKTLRFVLENPTPYFLQLLALPSFSPVRSQSDFSKMEAGLCNGPFIVKKWIRNDSIRLEKNPLYWDADRIKLDAVEIVIASDFDKLYGMFKNQELDILPTSTDIINSETLPYVEYYFNGANDFIRLNMSEDCPLHNKNLRLALNYALNRNAYVASLGSHTVTPSARYVLPILPGTHKTFGEEYPLEAFPLEGDTQIARDYLKKALEELRIEKAEDLSLELLISDDYWATIEAEIIREQMRNVLGIQIDIFAVPYNTHMELDAAHKFQMSLSGWTPDYPDPATYLELWTSNSSYNYAGYNSPEYDECFRLANNQTDPQSRMSLLARAEDILLRDGALIPLQIRQSAMLKNPKLTGFKTSYFNVEFQYIYADFLP
ncbi:peptide ABC transporter substrate-binding protein [Clostridium sp. D33t1_170424_F3]|uniref:peptide ABC transporter substrate-binding protein n=1 Tax=Clostridium sp. D33t1_170424_F3 TaxID=2787099 RepID=UPI0018AA7754|nr:peptide ABC transporter substrate-binding protein [Clostridium sp. D33t1_170424_F3]